VRGTVDLPLAQLLAPFGVNVDEGSKASKPSLGAKTGREGNDCKLASVFEGGAAHRAGLSGGDLLVAIDGVRVTASNLDSVLGRYRIGDRVTVHAFRRDELLQFELTLRADDAPNIGMMAETKPVAAARMRNDWLR